MPPDWQDWLEAHPLAATGAGLLALVLAAVLAHVVAGRLLPGTLKRIARRSRTRFDDALVERHVPQRLAQIAPAAVLQAGIALVPGVPPVLDALVRNVAMAFMAIMAALAVSGVLAAVGDTWDADPRRRQRSIKGYLQLARLVVFIVGGILAVAALIDRSPLLLFTGLGAMGAVLMLVFKDTLLSLVASVQLASNDVIRVGDWVEVPGLGVDGDVMDIALHTVKVRNFDRTISTIPTSRFITDAVKNWRGMAESGGRRIKRALLIDLQTVGFLDAQQVAALSRLRLLRDYLDGKQRELASHNAGLGDDAGLPGNARRLTNVGTFRAYVLAYLRARPDIRSDMTLIVRQLEPGPHGLPLELYCFTATTAWAEYEGIMSDVFDHLLAILPEFGLRAFQDPTGSDLRALADGARRSRAA